MTANRNLKLLLQPDGEHLEALKEIRASLTPRHHHNGSGPSYSCGGSS